MCNDFHLWKFWPFFLFEPGGDFPILLHCADVMGCEHLLLGKGFQSSRSSPNLPLQPKCGTSAQPQTLPSAAAAAPAAFEVKVASCAWRFLAQLLPGWVLSSRLLRSYFWSSFCYFIHYRQRGPNAGLCFICIYLVNEVPFALSELLEWMAAFKKAGP